MPNRTRLILAATGGFALAAIIALIGVAVLIHQMRPTNRVLWQDCQPDTLSYDEYDPYCVSLVEGDLNGVYFPMSFLRHRFLFVGRGTDTPAYGHYVDYALQASTVRGADIAANLTVEWTAEGLTLTEATGHSIFIPAEQFTGGR